MASEGFARDREFIEVRFSQEWADRTPVAWDNVAEGSPRPGEGPGATRRPWVRLTLLGGGGRRAGLGSAGVLRQLGVVVVQIFTPAGSGTALARELADAAAAVFVGWSAPGLSFGAPALERPGVDGGWYRLVVSIPFTSEHPIG